MESGTRRCFWTMWFRIPYVGTALFFISIILTMVADLIVSYINEDFDMGTVMHIVGAVDRIVAFVVGLLLLVYTNLF